MKIVYGTLLATTMMLTAYLVFAIDKIIPTLQQSITDAQKAIEPLQAQLDKQQETLAAIEKEVKDFRKEVNDRIIKEETRKKTLKALAAALVKIDEAEAIHKAGDLVKATEALLSIKDTVWKAGDFFQSEQATFRGLMAPIDATTGQWKTGNAAADTTQISAGLKAVLDKVSSDQ